MQRRNSRNARWCVLAVLVLALLVVLYLQPQRMKLDLTAHLEGNPEATCEIQINGWAISPCFGRPRLDWPHWGWPRLWADVGVDINGEHCAVDDLNFHGWINGTAENGYLFPGLIYSPSLNGFTSFTLYVTKDFQPTSLELYDQTYLISNP